nr:hypothetical protein [Tanacetum cinerariifolium]GEZ94793.1 hypothetical protein [Tanacetum cinerariifolium]
MDQLEKQIDKEEFQEIRSMAAFKVLGTQFQTFIKSHIYLGDEYVIMTRKYFLEYTQRKIREIRDTLVQHMEYVRKSIDKKSLHKRDYNNRVNERQMQKTEEKVDTSKALDASLVDTESIVRQPIVFKSERPRTLKPRFASQVDVNDDLSKLVTTYYLPKEREFVVVKPHHVIVSGKSSNSSKNMPRFSSNDMVHNHYLYEARKKTQEKGRNSKPSVMPYARSQTIANGSKPKPRINNQNSRNWPASKSNFVMTKPVPIAEHSRNSRNFLDSKHFVCLTCQKCVFNANHDYCVTKFLNKVNLRAEVPSHKTTKRYRLVEKMSIAKKPERQILTRHSSELAIQDHNDEQSSSKLVPDIVPPTNKTSTSQQELELLFSPMYEEYFNTRNPRVSKSSALSNNSTQHDTQPTLNDLPIFEPINPPTNVNAKENM